MNSMGRWCEQWQRLKEEEISDEISKTHNEKEGKLNLTFTRYTECKRAEVNSNLTKKQKINGQNYLEQQNRRSCGGPCTKRTWYIKNTKCKEMRCDKKIWNIVYASNLLMMSVLKHQGAWKVIAYFTCIKWISN